MTCWAWQEFGAKPLNHMDVYGISPMLGVPAFYLSTKWLEISATYNNL